MKTEAVKNENDVLKKYEIIKIANQMIKARLPKEFISNAVTTAFEYEGVYDLLRMWSKEKNLKQRKEIIADIQELIEDCNLNEKTKGMYIHIDDLESIAKNIRAFKDSLREIVDQKGGIKRLSELTGYPQPSLSRFFNSASVPRRSMLNKIAKALNINKVHIIYSW